MFVHSKLYNELYFFNFKNIKFNSILQQEIYHSYLPYIWKPSVNQLTVLHCSLFTLVFYFYH